MALSNDILPDEIVERHLGGNPKPAGGAGSPAADLDDTDDVDLEGDAEGTDDDEAGGELEDEFEDEDEDEAGAGTGGSDDDEDLEEEDDEDLDEEDEDADLDDDDSDDDGKGGKGKEKGPTDFLESVTAEDRERIKADPALRKLHKQMLGDYTRKTMALATGRKEVESVRAQQEQFTAGLRTPEGALRWTRDVALADPFVAAAAFEAIATGDGAKDFLVEVGLAKPELLTAAYERVMELHDDEDEKARHIRDRDRKRDDADYERRKLDRSRERAREVISGMEATAERLAKKAGLEPEDAEIVLRELRAEVRSRVSAQKPWELSKDEIKRLVLGVRKDVRAREERVAARLKRRRLQEEREQVKQRARKGAQRRPAPRSSGAPAGKRKKFTAPTGRDPLDSFIDARLGND